MERTNKNRNHSSSRRGRGPRRNVVPSFFEHGTFISCSYEKQNGDKPMPSSNEVERSGDPAPAANASKVTNGTIAPIAVRPPTPIERDPPILVSETVAEAPATPKVAGPSSSHAKVKPDKGKRKAVVDTKVDEEEEDDVKEVDEVEQTEPLVIGDKKFVPKSSLVISHWSGVWCTIAAIFLFCLACYSFPAGVYRILSHVEEARVDWANDLCTDYYESNYLRKLTLWAEPELHLFCVNGEATRRLDWVDYRHLALYYFPLLWEHESWTFLWLVVQTVLTVSVAQVLYKIDIRGTSFESDPDIPHLLTEPGAFAPVTDQHRSGFFGTEPTTVDCSNYDGINTLTYGPHQPLKIVGDARPSMLLAGKMTYINPHIQLVNWDCHSWLILTRKTRSDLREGLNPSLANGYLHYLLSRRLLCICSEVVQEALASNSMRVTGGSGIQETVKKHMIMRCSAYNVPPAIFARVVDDSYLCACIIRKHAVLARESGMGLLNFQDHQSRLVVSHTSTQQE